MLPGHETNNQQTTFHLEHQGNKKGKVLTMLRKFGEKRNEYFKSLKFYVVQDCAYVQSWRPHALQVDNI